MKQNKVKAKEENKMQTEEIAKLNRMLDYRLKEIVDALYLLKSSIDDKETGG